MVGRGVWLSLSYLTTEVAAGFSALLLPNRSLLAPLFALSFILHFHPLTLPLPPALNRYPTALQRHFSLLALLPLLATESLISGGEFLAIRQLGSLCERLIDGQICMGSP